MKFTNHVSGGGGKQREQREAETKVPGKKSK